MTALELVLARAIQLAATPPVRKGAHTFWAQVRWTDIEQLRLELDALGVDWRAVKNGADDEVRVSL